MPAARPAARRARTMPVVEAKKVAVLGAAGGVEATFSVLAIKHSLMPPTINYENPDPECDLDYVPNVARSHEIDLAMSNSFGFGGTNCTLVFRRFK